jgi:hypothetical protein
MAAELKPQIVIVDLNLVAKERKSDELQSAFSAFGGTCGLRLERRMLSWRSIQNRTTKMIRQLRSLGYRVELVTSQTDSPE